MENIATYKKKTVFKAAVLPLLITAVVILAFLKFLPSIESKLPDGPAYTAAEQENEEGLH